MHAWPGHLCKTGNRTLCIIIITGEYKCSANAKRPCGCSVLWFNALQHAANFFDWVDFYFQKRKTAFFKGLTSNVRTPSVAHWKLSWLHIRFRHNWSLFTISYGWDVISGNLSKSASFEGGGLLWAQISEGRGRRPPTTVGVTVAEWLPFRVV